MSFEEMMLSLQLLAEERVGSRVRSAEASDDDRFAASADALRRIG
jgi:hypothetical protein